MIWILLLLLQQVHSNEICSPGFYKSASEQCATCEPGKYQDLPGQTSCKICIIGQYQNLYTSIACETCPSDITDGECIDQRLLCPTGKFNGRLSNNCTKCSAGFFSNYVGTTSCESCPRGKSQNLEGKTSCDDCPEKTESNNIECQQCASKWLRHSFLCSDTCPDKTFQNASDNNICESCSKGKYLKDNTCTECPLGFTKERDGPTDCNQCPQDYISNQQKCEKCGNYTVVDNNECKCKQGFVHESNVCVECSSTEYQDEIGQDSCKACTANKVSGYNNVCEYCPTGTGYSDGSCKTCPNGWARHDPDNGTCKECAKGKYSTDNRCVDCRIGFYQDQKAKIECKYCPNAEYQNEVGQTNCKTCIGPTPQTNLIGKGSTFCCGENQCDTDKCGPGRDRSSSDCTKCPSGKWSTQNSNCQDCPMGYIAPTAESHECTMCSDGEESNLVHTQCSSCPAGQYEEGYKCKSCARGKFNPAGRQTSCESCPSDAAGKPQTTVGIGQTTKSNCEACSDNLVIQSNGVCGDCGQGEFVESYECKTCPTGYFQDNNHQTSCTGCLPGETTIGPGASSCVFCTGDDCGCAPGQYGPPCETCPKGWWSTGGVKCNACTERTYQDEEGQNSCKNCVAGKYSDVIGLEQCKICPNGYFQNKDTQGSCFDCPIGRYSLSGYDKECDKCPAGSTTEYENSVSQEQCTECPAGKYESSGVCNDCLESFYQDEEGQYTGCKSCPGTTWSEPGSASESEDCFETGTLTTYTFGNMEDQTTSSAFETTCEIRPNFVLLCPACTCNSDSRNGFWNGPLCNECQRGFATRYCTSICPGYNGQDDSTMCNGNGRCWFGRFGNGLCYCGGKHVIDQTAENSFVDVRTCPRGQICPGYGSSSVESASYIPQYYIIQYRQFTTFVLQMSKYTPERGHMWFKRYPPSKAYENSCSLCTSNYDSSLTTEIGYWANDGEYKKFPPQAQTANGFHGENCQHECAVCLNNGYCVHSPHPFYYSYTIKDTFMEKGRVIIPTTACICRASVFDASHMCCPNGFQPYVYYGSKHTDPYSRFDTVPFITSIDNQQTLPYHRDRDLWLYSRNDEPQYPPVYSEPESGQFSVAVRSEIENKNYHEVGPYNKHVYHGTTREICRACPGLFGKGVRAQERLIQTEQEAEDYWWDFSASSGDKKCANQGVCDFYAKDREIDVDFMGNVATWSLLHRGVLCRSNPTFQFQNQETLEKCVKYANIQGALFVGFGPDFYKGGNSQQLIPINDPQTKDNAIISVTATGKKGWARKDSFVNDIISSKYYVVDGKLPPPDSDSEYKIYPNFQGNKCIGYTKCESYTENSYQYNIYDVTRGRGDDRFYRTSVNALTQRDVIEESTYDRFDTCFTYTKDNNRVQFDLYLTIGYKQGLDPFIGGLCPRGYFCTQSDDAREPDNNGIPPVGYKEACPPGYYQPQYGITRTDNNVRCNKGKGIHNMRYEVSTDFCTDTTDTYVRNGNKQIKDAVECKAAAQYLGLTFTNKDFTYAENTDHNYPRGCFKSLTSDTTVTQIFYNNNEEGKEECTTTSGSIGCVCRKSNPCQLNTATFQDNDYVDSVCLRCPRHTWSAEGSYECNECPKGTVKKISGNFSLGELDVFNMDTIQNDHWYYIQNEMGTEQDDCAKVPPAVVHIPQLNTVMKESAQNQQFLPLITCPYGFSNRPGTYVIQDTWALSNIDTDIDFALPPYVKNNGIESAIVSDVPCDCIAEDKENGIKYLTPPTLEKCWQYAHVSSTLPKCNSNSMGKYVLEPVECSGNRKYVMNKDECRTYAESSGLDFQEQELQAGPPGCSTGGTIVYYIPSTLGACNSATQCVCFEENIQLCTTAGEGVNAEYMDNANIFWDGCSKFKDSNTVHYQYTTNQPTKHVKNTPDSLQFICLKKVTNMELTKQIAAQYCFTCPGDSITGPETGICSTCPGNMVKKNMKLAIQKLVERSYPRLYQCYRSDSNVIENNIKPAAQSYGGGATTAPKDELMKCNTMVRPREDTSIDVEYKEDNIQAWQFIIDEDTIWKVDSVFWPIIESSDMSVSKLTLSDCVLACSTTWGSELNKDRKVRVGIALKESDRNFCLCNDGGSTEAYYRYVGEKKNDVLRQAKYKKSYTVQQTRCDDITNRGDCGIAAVQMGTYLSDYVFSAAQKIKIPHGCYQKNDGIVFYNDDLEGGLEACTSDYGAAAGCVCVDKTITTSDSDYNYLAESSNENILWYQSQVEEPWNKIRPLCGSCTPGKILRGSKCENCAEGQFTSTPEEAMQATCQNCPMGFYQSSRGKSYCSMCMVGLAINTVKAQNCKECQAGYYGNERGKGPATSYETVDGSYIKCKECPTGFFQAFSKKTSCDECVHGKYESQTAQTTCKQCQPGEYTDQNRQIDCKDCPEGYHNSLTSQPSCKECSPGKYEDTKKQIASYCKPCAVGQYQNIVAQEICKPCEPPGTTEKPDGLLRQDNYFGFQDSQGQTTCKACIGGHTCTGSAATSCPAGNINPLQNEDPDGEATTKFTSTCTPCDERTAANNAATACVPCAGPKKMPSSSGIGCSECPHGSHSVNTSGTGRNRPVCTPCSKSQKIIPTGCTPCGPGMVMDATEDDKCASCTGNTIALGGVCTACPDLYKPNTAHTICEKCGGYDWGTMFTGFASSASDTGGKFANAVVHREDTSCKNNGPGPQIICYATWKIKFTEDTDNLCFEATAKVDDQVAIYIKDVGSSVGFPAYFDQKGCDCNGGCACMTDYPYLMDFDSTWGKKSSLQWWTRGTTGEKCMDIDVAKDGEKLLVMWFFNEDDGAGNQALKLTTSTVFKANNTC